MTADQMGQQAAQIWPILCKAAKDKKGLYYGDVSKIIGGDPIDVGKKLEPIQSYCLINRLPILTVLVVNKGTGMPGTGCVVPETFFQAEKEDVFHHNWADEHIPTPATFLDAVNKCPSCGNPNAKKEYMKRNPT